MNAFFQGMKLVKYLVSVNVRNCISGSRNNVSGKLYYEPSVGSSLGIFMPANNRNFVIYPLICSKKSDHNKKVGNKTGSVKDGAIVSVIDENNVEVVMSLIDAEKFAKRKNLKLVLLENNTGNKVKYKLQKSEHKKDSEKYKKRVVVREETQPHDVEVKIKQMVKFIDKGMSVSCHIEGSGNAEKQNKILNLIEQSKLKECIVSKVQRKKSVQIIFQLKSSEGKNPAQEKENEDNTQSSK